MKLSTTAIREQMRKLSSTSVTKEPVILSELQKQTFLLFQIIERLDEMEKPES